MYQISREKEEAIRLMLAARLPLRQIVRTTGVAMTTVLRRTQKDWGKLTMPRVKSRPGHCDFCGGKITGAREFDRRTRRTTHKFCSHECYGLFCRARRANDKCRRCGRRRYEKACSIFTRGYCAKCYGTMRQFGFDQDLADAYDLKQLLAKEIRDAAKR